MYHASYVVNGGVVSWKISCISVYRNPAYHHHHHHLHLTTLTLLLIANSITRLFFHPWPWFWQLQNIVTQWSITVRITFLTFVCLIVCLLAELARRSG